MCAVKAKSPTEKVSLIGFLLSIFAAGSSDERVDPIGAKMPSVLPSLPDAMVDPVGLVVSVVPLAHQMKWITNWPQHSHDSRWWRDWSSRLHLLFHPAHETKRLIQLPHGAYQSSRLVRWHIWCSQPHVVCSSRGSVYDRLDPIWTDVSVTPAASSHNTVDSVNFIMSAAGDSE